MALYVRNTQIPGSEVKNIVIKTLKSHIEDINQNLSEIRESMGYFERKYGIDTDEFYAKFTEGTMGDDMDFFEWKASKEIYEELKGEKKALLEAIR